MATETVPAAPISAPPLTVLAEIARLANTCDDLLTDDVTTAREEAALMFVRQIGALADAACVAGGEGPRVRGDFVDWMAPYLKEASHG